MRILDLFTMCINHSCQYGMNKPCPTWVLGSWGTFWKMALTHTQCFFPIHPEDDHSLLTFTSSPQEVIHGLTDSLLLQCNYTAAVGRAEPLSELSFTISHDYRHLVTATGGYTGRVAEYLFTRKEVD